MAVIHHQLESIHPFYNGNGRTGRIINILYLVQQGLLDSPILYLSRYINRNKSEYYRLLQMVRNSGYSPAAWEEWVLFIVTGVEETSHQTTILANEIKRLMQHHKAVLREQLPKIYNQDLINNLFRHPYTKIEFVMDDLQIHRATAAKHLDAVVQIGILSKHKIGTHNYYLNDALFDLLHSVGTQQNGQND
jgi:Fic family protein